MKKRPTWDEYFLKIAYLVATRTTCVRREVGSIVVHSNRILTTGYNGAPDGFTHCAKKGCLREQLKIPSGSRHELCRGVHAEQNAILQAAKFGISLDGAVIYVTTHPCEICAKLIINSGIKKIIYCETYPSKLTVDLLDEAKIERIRIIKDF